MQSCTQLHYILGGWGRHRCSQSPTLCVPICVTQGCVPICVTPFVSPTHSVCHHLAAPFCAAVCVQIFLGVSIAATFRAFHKYHRNTHLFLIRKDNHQYKSHDDHYVQPPCSLRPASACWSRWPGRCTSPGGPGPRCKIYLIMGIKMQKKNQL